MNGINSQTNEQLRAKVFNLFDKLNDIKDSL